MKPNRKPLLAILAFVPLVLTIIFMVWYVNALMTMMGSMAHTADEAMFVGGFTSIVRTAMLFSIPMIVLYIVSLILFIRDVLSRPAIGSGERAAWIVLMVIFSTIVFPVYYFMYVWNDRGKTMTPAQQNVAPPYPNYG